MKRLDITYERLYDLCIVQRKTMLEASSILNCGYNTVRRRMADYKLRESSSLEGSRIYNSWQNMKASCDYYKQSNYQSIGGVGISYSKEWSVFSGFYNDMKEGYSDNLFLSRLDRDKDFDVDNCYWATQQDISYSRISNIPVKINEKILTVREAGKIYKLKESTIHDRYAKGWRKSDLVQPLLENNIERIPHMKEFYDNGGIKVQLNYIGFTESKKRKVRLRDNNTCQECGLHSSMSIEKYGCDLHVHHIDYNKKNPNKDNLISLCVSCHMKTNHNREEWEDYFNNKFYSFV